MRRYALRALGAILLVTGLTGCVTRQVAPPSPGRAPAAGITSPHSGRPFDIVPDSSRLLLLVYRAGPLAALGHDHVIACRCVTGTVYLPADPLQASFALRIAVERLTVDDPALRAAEHSQDFPPDVPQSARQGTRRHMLGPALLNAAKYPAITLQSSGLRPAADGKPGDVIADVQVELDGERRLIAVPIHYEIRGGQIVATGEFPLRQTDLGLTPYSALGGALRVRDGMEARIMLTARRRE